METSETNPRYTSKGLKEPELRKHSSCARCGMLIGHTMLPMLYLVTVERHGLNLPALQRQTGLAMMMGGNGVLAYHMGANEDMTTPLMEAGKVMICEPCSTEPLCVAQLAEWVNLQAERCPEEEGQ